MRGPVIENLRGSRRLRLSSLPHPILFFFQILGKRNGLGKKKRDMFFHWQEHRRQIKSLVSFLPGSSSRTVPVPRGR